MSGQDAATWSERWTKTSEEEWYKDNYSTILRRELACDLIGYNEAKHDKDSSKSLRWLSCPSHPPTINHLRSLQTSQIRCLKAKPPAVQSDFWRDKLRLHSQKVSTKLDRIFHKERNGGYDLMSVLTVFLVFFFNLRLFSLFFLNPSLRVSLGTGTNMVRNHFMFCGKGVFIGSWVHTVISWVHETNHCPDVCMSQWRQRSPFTQRQKGTYPLWAHF